MAAAPAAPAFRFRLEASCGAARAGTFATPHGTVHTPAFMVVGTQGAVRGLLPQQLRDLGAEVVLANTYHLALRPGEALVAKLGGLHAFMRWSGPILTDSGGFQVFSLPRKEIHDGGVRFHSELDGRELELTPERSIEIQNALGADVIMAFDECTPYPADEQLAGAGVRRTLAWAERCVAAHARPADQALFGIVQGGVHLGLRSLCAEALVDLDLPGYAIGGVSVGEGHELLCHVTQHTAPLLPERKPRYLMGVGLPEDLLATIGSGIDLFDCVIPTRYARSGVAFTVRGRIRLSHRRFRRDAYAIDTSCDCAACAAGFTRGYLHHLFASGEILGAVLTSIHNLRFYQRLMAAARKAIQEGRYEPWRKAFLAEYQSQPSAQPGAADPSRGAPRPGARRDAADRNQRDRSKPAAQRGTADRNHPDRKPGAQRGAAERSQKGPGAQRGAAERSQKERGAQRGAAERSRKERGAQRGAAERSGKRPGQRGAAERSQKARRGAASRKPRGTGPRSPRR